MKTKIISLIFTIIVVLFCFESCTEKNKKKKSLTEGLENEMDIMSVDNINNGQLSFAWTGTYKGTLPCADCEGIKTEVILKKDGMFKRITQYLGKSNKSFSEIGSFDYDSNDKKITLNLDNGSSRKYEVVKNKLFHLDNNGQRITGDLADNYGLVKNFADTDLEDAVWVLVEMMGEIVKTQDRNKKITLKFISEEGRAVGHNGCNRYFGSYELAEGNRYQMGPLASTLMACDTMEKSTQFMEIIEKGDNYSIVDGILSLNNARMSTLAKFKFQE